MFFSSQQQLVNTDEPMPFTCGICSNKDDFCDWDVSSRLFDIMMKHKVCHHCAFWIDLINNPIYGHEIIDGFYFVIHPSVKRPLNVVAFSGGKEHYIRKNDGTLYKSNNIECKGKVPEQFKDKLPNTAVFLKLIDYQNLKNFPFTCAARGCWDRYNCIRYDISIEQEYGKFNEVPESHIIGSEPCPSFVKPYKFIPSCSPTLL